MPDYVGESMAAMGLVNSTNRSATEEKYEQLLNYLCQQNVDVVYARDILANERLFEFVMAPPYLAELPNVQRVADGAYSYTYTPNTVEFDSSEFVALFPENDTDGEYPTSANVYVDVRQDIVMPMINEWAPNPPYSTTACADAHVTYADDAIVAAAHVNGVTSDANLDLLTRRFNNMIDYLCARYSEVDASTYADDAVLTTFLAGLPFFPNVPAYTRTNGVMQFGYVSNPVTDAEAKAALFSTVPPCDQSVDVFMVPGGSTVETMTNDQYDECAATLDAELTTPDSTGLCPAYVVGTDTATGSDLKIYPTDNQMQRCEANGGSYAIDDDDDDGNGGGGDIVDYDDPNIDAELTTPDADGMCPAYVAETDTTTGAVIYVYPTDDQMQRCEDNGGSYTVDDGGGNKWTNQQKAVAGILTIGLGIALFVGIAMAVMSKTKKSSSTKSAENPAEKPEFGVDPDYL